MGATDLLLVSSCILIIQKKEAAGQKKNSDIDGKRWYNILIGV